VAKLCWLIASVQLFFQFLIELSALQESSDVVGVLPTRMKDLRVGQEMEDEMLCSQRNIKHMMIG